MYEGWIGGPYTDGGWCPNRLITSGCVRGCVNGCYLPPEERHTAVLRERASLAYEKWVMTMKHRQLKSDFISVTRPWLEKVANTKDLKPVRKANWKLELDAISETVNSSNSEQDIFHLLREKLSPLRERIVASLIGGKGTREDIWRRLLWLEFTIEDART